ncbi:MAG: tRNA pseudouridine(55) synthase TruB [Spirochaetales bacterium]|nr:tRNA pseudouridine(55) synthase TruB [Candidatus Physcosoma equi]
MSNCFSLILCDKEEGITSFRSLGLIKKEHRGEKVGHAGTLDKFASGLMLVMVGGATKLNPVFSSFDKRYIATVQFGSETSTLDPEGEVVYTSEHIPTREELEPIVASFIGKQKQVPPVYSALHIDGERAYLRAAKGQDVEMPERDIEIYSIALLSYENGIAKIDCHVSKGTYIRSLARDIALKAHSRGHLIGLRRTNVGPFSVDDKDYSTKELLDKTELFSAVFLDQEHRKEIDNGTIKNRWILSDSNPERTYCYVYFGDEFYGIGEKQDKLKIITRSLNGSI